MPILHIKNMVCPRCIQAVEGIIQDLDIAVESISLGKVIAKNPIDDQKRARLRSMLSKVGFHLLDDRQTQIINTIKSTIINRIHYDTSAQLTNFSTLLTEILHYDYAYLSRLFSQLEGRTIEKFIIAQKIERVKELITYQQMTLSEIADQMNYSSAAHLSTQFKKVTGMTPTVFKKIQEQSRHSLDEL